MSQKPQSARSSTTSTAVADLIAEVGESLGFTVTVAHDGSAFHDLYRRSNPSVIFLDLKLPGYDGIELLRFLGEEQCDATIFIASGLDPRTLAAAHAVGKQHNLDMGRALAKPLMLDDIESALKSHVKAGTRVRAEDVRRALANDELRVHFQPKVDLLDTAGTRMTGVEALARWAAPDGGWIFPDQFIPVAREAGLMRELTDVVADRSFAAASRWRNRGLDLAVSINLDTTTLNDRLLPDHLAQLADKYNVPAARVTLEITELAAMAAPEATMDILTRFRLKDFNVSIDDFGTGYSSLVQLYRLPFNELKIDKSFVMDIGAQRRGRHHRRDPRFARQQARPQGLRRGHRDRRHAQARAEDAAATSARATCSPNRSRPSSSRSSPSGGCRRGRSGTSPR